MAVSSMELAGDIARYADTGGRGACIRPSGARLSLGNLGAPVVGIAISEGNIGYKVGEGHDVAVEEGRKKGGVGLGVASGMWTFSRGG